MCMQLYIGSDNALPLNRAESAGFSPWELNPENENDSFANKNLAKKYKYGLRSCACGMAFDFPQTARHISELERDEKCPDGDKSILKSMLIEKDKVGYFKNIFKNP